MQCLIGESEQTDETVIRALAHEGTGTTVRREAQRRDIAPDLEERRGLCILSHRHGENLAVMQEHQPLPIGRNGRRVALRKLDGLNAIEASELDLDRSTSGQLRRVWSRLVRTLVVAPTHEQHLIVVWDEGEVIVVLAVIGGEMRQRLCLKTT